MRIAVAKGKGRDETATLMVDCGWVGARPRARIFFNRAQPFSSAGLELGPDFASYLDSSEEDSEACPTEMAKIIFGIPTDSLFENSETDIDQQLELAIPLIQEVAMSAFLPMEMGPQLKLAWPNSETLQEVVVVEQTDHDVSDSNLQELKGFLKYRVLPGILENPLKAFLYFSFMVEKHETEDLWNYKLGEFISNLSQSDNWPPCTGVSVLGYHSGYGEIVYQSFDDQGQLDEGILSDPENTEYYAGSKMLDLNGMKPGYFEVREGE